MKILQFFALGSAAFVTIEELLGLKAVGLLNSASFIQTVSPLISQVQLTFNISFANGFISEIAAVVEKYTAPSQV